MTTKTASTRTEGLLALFDLQTGFLSRALDGMSEQDMHNRVGTKANHMAWLAGALVAQRYMM
ncbi:MAG TPA: DinB family protein, partial [Flavipsychrobacter sp.]|nr:DinB family protein [Flavipsychrobacter sp.]